MAINYTSLLGLAQPVTGTEAGAWGTVVNTQITALVEEAIASTVSLDVTSGDITLTTTVGAANQARRALLLVTGTPGTTRNVIAPSQSKTYVVINSSNAAVVVKGVATTGATVASATRALVAWNGTDFVVVASSNLTDLGATTLGTNLVKIPNPSAVTFPRFNADNTVSALSATDFRTAIGAGVGTGTVTSIAVSGGTTGLTTTGGPITTSGTITLSGTLAVANGGTGATTLTGVVIGNGTSAFSVKTNPSGAFVGTTDTQTLSGKTITNLVFDGDYTEEVFSIVDGPSVDLDPGNGTVQTWTLGASRTPTANSFAAGQSMTLMVDDGADYAITWPSVVWVGGSPPTLEITGFTVIELWKVGTTLYGALVGGVA
jgi:hypothetical protein